MKNGQAKVTAIADALGVKKASVTGALNILSDKGLIEYSPYSHIKLSAAGEKIYIKVPIFLLIDSFCLLFEVSLQYNQLYSSKLKIPDLFGKLLHTVLENTFWVKFLH